jgi:hypothetical protein
MLRRIKQTSMKGGLSSASAGATECSQRTQVDDSVCMLLLLLLLLLLLSMILLLPLQLTPAAAPAHCCS